jgi:hypothetical protein
MNKFKCIFLASAVLLSFACHNKKYITSQLRTVDLQMLDSIKANSDTAYLKKYGRTDFVTQTILFLKETVRLHKS